MPQLSFYFQNASANKNLPASRQFRRWVLAALRVDTEVTLRIVDEKEGRALNKSYRDKDYATNVLTFPLTETPHLMGDIIICAPVVEAEAKAQNKTLAAHFAHLTVHGILHLHGYNHEIEAQANLMEALEIDIMKKLGFTDPYWMPEETHSG